MRQREDKTLPERDPIAGQRLWKRIDELLATPSSKARNELQLASQAAVSRDAIRKWRIGTHPTIDVIDKVAATLGTTPLDLWVAWYGAKVERRGGLGDIAREIGLLREAITAAGGQDPQVQGALEAIAAAREDRGPERVSAQPTVPDETAPPSRPGGRTRPR